MSQTFRASYSQQAMWHDYHLSGRNPVYHVALPATVESDVDVEVLRGSLQDVVDRHSALRTSLTVDDGRVDQLVHQRVPVDFDVVTLDGAEAANPDVAVEQVANAPFDLAAESPLRVRLFLGPPRPLLLFVVHHVACDFESLVIILEELGELYRTRITGSGVVTQASTTACGYHEFADWEKAYIESGRGQRALTYWTRGLADLSSSRDLPLDRWRGTRRTYAGAELESELPPRLVAGITRVSQDLGVARNAILLTAAHVLVGRLSTSRSAVIGLTSSQRQTRNFRRTVGNFTNPIVTISDLRAPATFGDLVRRINGQVMRSLPHSALPFPLLVERLNPDHDASRTPFFNVLYTYNRSRQRDQDALSGFIGGYGALELGDLTLRQVPMRRNGSNVDLSPVVFDSTNEIRLFWQYNTDLLDADTVRRVADHYRALLEAGVADPEAPLDSVASVLPEAERESLLTSAAGAEREWLGPATLTDRLERQSAKTPDQVAVTCEGTSLTYAQLHRRADRLAARLRAEGIGRDDRVGILLNRSPRLVVALLGVLKAGASCLPLDVSWPAATLRAIVAGSGARFVVTERNAPTVDTSCGPRLIDLDADTDGGGAAPTRSKRHPDSAASVSYTRGPTAEPQGVVHADRGILTIISALQERHSLDVSDAFLPQVSIGAGSAVPAILWPLMVGARIVLPGSVDEPGPEQLARLIRRHRVTAVCVEAPALRDILGGVSAEPLPSLRLVVCDGRALTGARLRAAESRLGCAVDSVHGWAEVGGFATWRPDEHAPAVTGAVGDPMPNVHCYVLDDQMRPLPRGVTGELYVAGPQLARGYLNRPDLTAGRFRPDPFRPGQRAFRTGELARWTSNGAIEHLGSVGGQITVGGYLVSLDEVRRAVEADDAVSSAIAVAHADEGRARVLAYVLPLDPAGFVPGSLWARLRATCPNYLVPSGIVALSRWPIGLAGEIAEDELPAPSSDSWLDKDAGYIAPRSPLEQEIARLWEDLLSIDQVGAHDDFFAIGGHSVMAARLIVRMKKRFGVELAFEDLFIAPTLAEFTEMVLKRAESSEQHPVDRKG